MSRESFYISTYLLRSSKKRYRHIDYFSMIWKMGRAIIHLMKCWIRLNRRRRTRSGWPMLSCWRYQIVLRYCLQLEGRESDSRITRSLVDMHLTDGQRARSSTEMEEMRHAFFSIWLRIWDSTPSRIVANTKKQTLHPTQKWIEESSLEKRPYV